MCFQLSPRGQLSPRQGALVEIAVLHAQTLEACLSHSQVILIIMVSTRSTFIFIVLHSRCRDRHLRSNNDLHGPVHKHRHQWTQVIPLQQISRNPRFLLLEVDLHLIPRPASLKCLPARVRNLHQSPEGTSLHVDRAIHLRQFLNLSLLVDLV